MRRVVFGNGLGRVGICRLSREGQGWRTGLGAGAGADFSEGLWSPEPWADPAWLPAHGVLLTGLPVTWGAVRAAGGPIQQMRKWRPGDRASCLTTTLQLLTKPRALGPH